MRFPLSLLAVLVGLVPVPGSAASYLRTDAVTVPTILVRPSLGGGAHIYAGPNLVSNVTVNDDFLGGAHLVFADLAGGADLTGMDFSAADLFRADLSGAIVVDADFSFASLTRAGLVGVDFSGVNLLNTSLAGANLSGAYNLGSTIGTPFYTDTTIFTSSWSGLPFMSTPFDPVTAGWIPGTEVDGDSVFDLEDNCLLVKNAPPLDCDTDKDGYGNLCDGDFSQDFAVNASDFNTYFIPAFKFGVDKAGVGVDMNCDGAITAVDFTSRFIPNFKAGKPGPSGLSCAGVAPCDL